MVFSASSGIHQGDRASQQDRVCILQNKREPKCVLAIVADGMGGLSGGRKASDQVMFTAEQLFGKFDSQTDDAQQLLEQIVQEAHMVIGMTAMSSELQPHSTFAAFLITAAGACYWAHVGDSRIYHAHKSQLVHRTVDHSYVQSLLDTQQITPQQAIHHPKSNILTQCLGGKFQPLVTHHLIPQIQSGDSFLVCSDGVWPYFADQELASMLDQLSPSEATELMIATARKRSNQRGDNLSIAIIKVA